MNHENLVIIVTKSCIQPCSCRCITYTAISHRFALAWLFIAKKFYLHLCRAILSHLPKFKTEPQFQLGYSKTLKNANTKYNWKITVQMRHYRVCSNYMKQILAQTYKKSYRNHNYISQTNQRQKWLNWRWGKGGNTTKKNHFIRLTRKCHKIIQIKKNKVCICSKIMIWYAKSY